MATSLKDRKEEFVTGLTGGSTYDIYLVTSISLTSYLVWSVLKKKTSCFDRKNDIFGLFLDALINWNNLLMSVTVYSNHIGLLTFLNVLPLTVVLFNKSKESKKQVLKINPEKLSLKQFLPFKSYITVYRAQMMVITCICILAVDFKIFPRRFAKVETWGTSLMDLGVGSFVFSMGLISSRSILRQNFACNYSYVKNVIGSLKSSIPLIALGLVRLVSVKSLDYQEHLAEYGKHWNFFFTLSMVPLLVNVLYPLIHLISPLVFSLLLMFGYEVVLVKYGALEYIVQHERTDLLSQNKEGLFSLVGYLAIFLNGYALGYILLPLFPTGSNLVTAGFKKQDLVKGAKNRLLTLKPIDALVLMSVVYQVLYFVIDTSYVYGVSRRMANALYVIWVSAYNCSFLLGYILVQKFVWGDVEYELVAAEDEDETVATAQLAEVALNYENSVPQSLMDVNSNSLVLFLLANVLTGVINMAYNTLDSTPSMGLLVLIAYEGVLGGIASVLRWWGIVLR